jgi:hypothetical protein
MVESNLRTTTSHECEAVPRRARISGPWTCVSPNARLESNQEEKRRDAVVQEVTTASTFRVFRV